MVHPQLKIAFSGPSGTGKTTLALALSDAIPRMSVSSGYSRRLADSWGLSSPYEVDADPSLRIQFQRELLETKLQTELGLRSFVTDRTGADEYAYTMLHCPQLCADLEYTSGLVYLTGRYDVVFFCSTSTFQNTAGDPVRKTDPFYHQASERLMLEFYRKYEIPIRRIGSGSVDERVEEVLEYLKQLYPALARKEVRNG